MSDSGTEFVNSKLKTILRKHGVTMRTSMTDTPQQNGAAERENRIVIKVARSIVHHKSLPIKLWAEACNTAIYVLNYTAPMPIKGKTPQELWTGEAISFKTSRLRIFGTKVWYLLPNNMRNGKFSSKSRFGLLVGYEDCNGYRIWDMGRRDIVRFYNVTFELERSFELVPLERKELEEAETTTPRTIIPESTKPTAEDNQASECDVSTEDIEVEKGTRPQRDRRAPAYLKDYVCHYAFSASILQISIQRQSTRKMQECGEQQ